MSRRRNSSKVGPNLLKFSDLSITSARARHVHNDKSDGDNVETSATSCLLNTCFRRRRFFDDSTGIGHVLHQMILFSCKNITTTSLLPNRLFIYGAIIVIGSILNEFVPGLFRLFRLSSKSMINKLFIRFGWGISMVIVVTFVFLLSHSLQLLRAINYDRIECSFDEYQTKKNQQRLHQQQQQSSQQSQQPKETAQTSNDYLGFKSSNREANWTTTGAISLNEISLIRNNNENDNLKKIEYQLNTIVEKDKVKRFTMPWLVSLWNVDMTRLIICNLVYIVTIHLFRIALNFTRENISGRSMQNYSKLMKSTDGNYQYFDISGHLFVLIFTNLILFEESDIIAHYEHLVEKMSELFKEYLRISLNEGSNITQVFMLLPNLKEDIIALGLAKQNMDLTKMYIKSLFILATIYSIFVDIMILQTSFFYHTIFEKIAAFVWAIFCWYGLYHYMFPMLALSQKKIILIKHFK